QPLHEVVPTRVGGPALAVPCPAPELILPERPAPSNVLQAPARRFSYPSGRRACLTTGGGDDSTAPANPVDRGRVGHRRHLDPDRSVLRRAGRGATTGRPPAADGCRARGVWSPPFTPRRGAR